MEAVGGVGASAMGAASDGRKLIMLPDWLGVFGASGSGTASLGGGVAVAAC